MDGIIQKLPSTSFPPAPLPHAQRHDDLCAHSHMPIRTSVHMHLQLARKNVPGRSKKKNVPGRSGLQIADRLCISTADGMLCGAWRRGLARRLGGANSIRELGCRIHATGL